MQSLNIITQLPYLEYTSKRRSKRQWRAMPELIEGAQQAIHKDGQGSMLHEGVWGV